MKLRKKIGITLLSLTLMTVSGMGILWAASRVEQADVIKNSPMEESSEGTEAVLRPGSDVVESNSQEVSSESNETVVQVEQVLRDMEDYSQAPADNGCPYYIKVNRVQNVVTIYMLDENGYYTKPIKAMVCSVGMNDGTPTGTFETSGKYEWCSLVGGVYGQYAYRIQGQIMFHSVPYYSMNKSKLETEEYNKLGEAASLGCVRLSVADAKWIYDNCPRGTIVTIYDSDYPGPLGKPVAETIDVDEERAGWDPTDPDEDNPWHTGKPRILCAGERTIERGCTYQTACGVLALDGSGNVITEQLVVKGTVDAMTVGEYPVVYEVEDEEGNVTSVTGVIRVIDTIAPNIVVKQDEIMLNRVQASSVNGVSNIAMCVDVVDSGELLSKDCLDIHIQRIEDKMQGSYEITIQATDLAGNPAEPKKIIVHLDREAPTIEAPEQKTFTASDDGDLEQQLRKAISVTDNYSDVQEVGISWVWEPATGDYTVLVTAKDAYGNVSTAFLHGFDFSFETNE